MKWRAVLTAGVLIAVFICSGCGMNGKITREQAVKSAERCRTDIERIADKYNGTLLLDCQNNTFGASAVLNQPE